MIIATLSVTCKTINSFQVCSFNLYHFSHRYKSSKWILNRFSFHRTIQRLVSQLSISKMFLIASLLILSIFQGIIVNQVQGGHHNLDEDRPEKFYVTHEAWFNISIRESKISPVVIKNERVVIALFGEICPMTVTNFITITKGLRRGSVITKYFLSLFSINLIIQDKFSFKNTPVHRVVRDFVIQTGDFTNGDGTGGN